MGCGKSTGKVTQAVIKPKPKLQQSPVSTITNTAHKEDPGAVKGESSVASRLTYHTARLSDLASMYRVPGKEPTLRLEYAYGYATKSVANNLFYLSSSDLIVYPAASMCVLLSASSNTQRFLGCGEVHRAKGHLGELSALTLSPARDLIATSESSELPLICLWELPGTAPLLAIEVTGESKGIKLLAFNQDATLIAAVDSNTDETVRVYNVKSGQEVVNTSGSPGNILTLAWNPKTAELYTAGNAHFAVWRPGKELVREDKSGMQNVSVVRCRQDGSVIVGQQDGKLLHMSSSLSLISTYSLLPPNISITALVLTDEEVLVGSSDSKVLVLDLSFQQTRVIETPGVPFSLDKSGSGVLCGTREGTIVEFGRNGRIVLMDVHSEGEITAITFDKGQEAWVLSAGGDNKLKCWDTSQKRCLVTGLMEMGRRTSQARTMDSEPQGNVAIGYDDGHFTVRMNSFQLNNIVAVERKNTASISVLKYNPAGTVLAIGTDSGLICLYTVKAYYPLLREIRGHKGKITAIDWDTTGRVLRSQDIFLVEKRWKVESGEAVAADSSQEWASDSRLLVTGVEGGSSIAVKSPVSDLVVQGGASGLVELFDSRIKAPPLAFKAHSYLLRSAVWSADGQTLVTAGGRDLTLLQWKLS